MKAIIMILLMIGAGSVAADLNEGLSEAWTFDDYSTTPVLHGDAEVVRSGKFGKALNLNGTNAYATAELSDEIEADLEHAFTIAYWLYVRPGHVEGGPGDHSGIYKGERVWGSYYTFRVVVTDDTNMMWGTVNAASENWFYTPGVTRPEEWVHVALTADGERTTAYVTMDGKTTIPPSPSNVRTNPTWSGAPYRLFPNEPLVMGRGFGFQGDPAKIQYLNGMIDDVMLWNRALREAEVTALGAGERPVLAVDPVELLATTWGQVKAFTR